MRRVPVRGSADNAEESRTVENPENESPAGGDHPGGDWQTGGSAGYSEERYPEDRMSGTPMGAQDEQTWSVLAHLSVLAGLVGLMPFGALIIWLVYKDRSPRVGFHALQSLWYQIAWIVILIVGWFLTFILSFILIGFLLVPVMALASLVPFIHGCYAAYKVSQGVDYRYPFVAGRIGGDARRTL
ncbi:MAG: DUF4870 domain-containing protein [Actinomycetota bacterium]|nr:DUF4870 domain-containing protein [Actinomycetota bacterium]